MINRNHAQQIRACERIKFDQALYILTMYEKKIRKSRKSIQGVIDADAEMQDIICSWKNKWKMDLTKPILNCVTSVYPRILVDHSRQDNEHLANYYDLINRFITRLRAEHEDQTNFKMVLQVYDKQLEYMTEDKYQASAKATVKGLLMMSRDFADLQIKSMLKNYDVISDENLDVNTDSIEWRVQRPLRYIREVSEKALLGESEMEVENDIEPKCEKTESLITFCTNVVKMMERIKQSQHGSTLITVQPKINELTLLFHPLLAAIAANFKKENNEKTKDMIWSKIDVQSIPMMENLKNSYNSSRVVLINLDGYESQYNLEIVRSFKKHLLYVSFPKEQAKLDEAKEIYSKRFFKKLMFRYSQSLFSSFSEAQMNEDYRALTKMERLVFNPEDYHSLAEKLYQNKNQKTTQDFNQNIYVFPIRMNILREKFPDVFESKEDIQNHQSYFIRFIIKDFLLNQIRQFNPTLIMVSYSGRIHIEDHHFVQLMQEFTKIANYKVLLFPNLTTAFLDEESIQVLDKNQDQYEYDNVVSDARIAAPFKPVHDSQQEWTDLFNKLSRFLKVSSGTYNLSRSFQEQALVSKYKNQFILTYIDDLMIVLGKEYYNIDKIRFRNRDLSILPKLFEDNIRNIKKTFEHTIPKIYSDIYDIIQYLLLDRQQKCNPKKQQLIQDYSIDTSPYRPYIQQLYDQLIKKSNFEVYVVDYQSIGDQIQKLKIKKMREMFNNQKESHLFQISSEKFEEKVNIFIKTEPQNKEYSSITEQTQSLRGLFQTSFYTNPGKVSLKLYDSTKLLYQIDQRFRKNNRIPVLIMNNLTDGCDYSFQNYYSQIDISNAHTADKKTFQERKCLAVPIFFENEQGLPVNKKRMQILAEWNYHQSAEYLLLYWPSKYDFFKAFLMKMMNKPYQPQILNQIYFCKKGIKTPVFRKVQLVVDYDLPARMGTSSYQFQGKIFIFGGFYQKQKNYLQMQHDVVTFDLRVFEQAGQNKLPVCNIKSQLYGSAVFQERLGNKQKQNSFIRPRIEFQFFDKEQLYNQDQTIPEQGVKTVIMMGGYGQNFIRPYSLLTYYYYLLRFESATRNLINIQKKIIYNKAIPVNTRQMTKNLGVIKTNRKNKSSMLQTKKLTDPDAYTLYRNSFKIDIKDGEEDFNYKFKYMFSEDQYKNFKHQIKKIYELKVEEFDSSSITVERDLKNNHRITLEKDGKKKEVQLRMQIPLERAKKIQGSPKEVSLTHQSIIYLDSCNSIISAIVKHDKYTQGKSVLVQYNTKCLEGFNFDQDDISHLAMTWIKQFDFDLTLHILIICNKNTVAILHGQKLSPIDSIKQFIVKRKKNKNQIAAFDIKDRQQLLLKNEQTELINTIFFRNRNKILSIDFVAVSDSSYFYISWQQIELNVSNDIYRWETSSADKIDPTVKYEFCIAEKNFVRMDQLRFVQFFKNNTNTEYYLVVELNRRKYICELNLSRKVLELVEQGFMKFEPENMERGVILVKTEDKYNDRNFF